MELWIRSQDRDYLEKVEKVYFWKDGFGEYQIEGNDKLGTYKTKKRALEVLDEIQDLLKPRMITTNYQCEIQENPIDKTSFNLDMKPQKLEIQEFSTYVYEMPKE